MAQSDGIFRPRLRIYFWIPRRFDSYLRTVTYGSILQGKSSINTFALAGTQNDDAICGVGLDQPVPATFSGQCGQGVTIQFMSSIERGTFTGNVACI